MANGLSENDPYRAMVKSEKEDVRPGFLGGEGEEGVPIEATNDRKNRVSARNDVAQNELSDAEERAGDVGDGGFYRPTDAREEEGRAGGFYSGGGKGVEKSEEKNKKGIKGILSKGAPLFFVFGVIFGIGGFVGMSQLFLPFSLVAQFTETFNSMHVSANVRSDAFFAFQMSTGRVKNPIKGKIFSADTFKITPTQADNLSRCGIEYIDDYKYEYDGDTESARVLRFTDSDMNVRIVAADADVAKRIGGDAIDFKSYYATDADFFESYNSGSMTWRGAIANWFGNVTGIFMDNNKISRNLFHDFQKKVNEADGDTRVAAIEIMSRGTEEIDEGGTRVVTGEAEKNSDGKEVMDGDRYKIQTDDEDGLRFGDGRESGSSRFRRTDIDSEDVKAKLKKIGDDYNGGSSITSGASKVVNSTCLVINFLGGVSLLVSAAEALQIIRLTTSYFEAVDKTKAGYGDETPINDLNNALTEKKTNTDIVLTKGVGTKDDISEDGIKSLSTETVVSDKSAMESSGISSLYGGGRVNPNDPSVQSFNFTSSINGVLGGIGTNMDAFRGCALAKIVTNAASAVSDIAKIGACVLGIVGSIFTVGVSVAGTCAPALLGALSSIVAGVGIGILIMGIISTITPIVSNMLTRDLISELGGVDLGNALTSGGNMYLGSTHRANGGSLGTREEYVAYRVEQQKVVAENAKYERATFSPFDLTSKYTFMGTLLTNVMSFMSSSSLMNTVTTTGSVISSSISALTPATLAINLKEDLNLPSEEEYEETCPYLASIGAVGDAYCNPYSMTDFSTINDDPLDVIKRLDEGGNFMDSETSDGNVKIKDNSDLAKYILYCDNRESAFGIADQNIVNSLMSWKDVRTGSAIFNNISNSAIGATPSVGDVIDVVQNTQALEGIGYVGGESCVAGNRLSDSGPFSDSPSWSMAKYYQRFIEDQSLAESIGLTEKSAVAAFLDDYYEKNPLDNSYEGILARKSGLDKETVVALLDIIDYGNYIANYHPEERYAFGKSNVNIENELRFDNEYVLSSEPVLIRQIEYADVRNRNYVV